MKASKLFELYDRMGRKLSKRLAYIFQREGLSTVELSMLWRIYTKQACRVGELSGESGISPSTITGILDRLVARGLLERAPDPEDRRGILMKSVPATSALIERLITAVDEEMEIVLSVLPEGRVQEMIEDMQLILNFLEQDKQ